MLTTQQRAAEVMRHLVTHGSHGYSQYSRNGDGGSETVTLSDGLRVTIATGDRDCSSGVIDAYSSVGVDCGGATYTGNMRSCMAASGNFRWHPWDDDSTLQVGGVVLNERNHTAMCVSDDFSLAEFSISETYGIDGQEGDQTGWESSVKPFYEYGHGGWDGWLEYVGPQPGSGGVPEASEQTVCGIPAETYAQWCRELQVVLSDELVDRGMAGVGVDGVDGPETERGVARLLQDVHDGTWGAGLEVDGIIGPATLASMAAHPVGLAQGCERSGDDAWAIKMALVLNGWDCDLCSREWTKEDHNYLCGHQQAHGLAIDGVCGPDTLASLLPLALA